MKMHIAYEVSDLRENPGYRLGPVGILQSQHNGILIQTNATYGYVVDLTDDEDGSDLVEDRWKDGVIVFNLPNGRIVLTRLTLANYRERVYPYLNGNPGPFTSDDEVNAYFYKSLVDY